MLAERTRDGKGGSEGMVLAWFEKKLDRLQEECFNRYMYCYLKVVATYALFKIN